MTVDYSHLHPLARKRAGEDATSRVAHIRERFWVSHDAAQRASELMQEAMDQCPSDRMMNVLVAAESGMGKTALVRRFQKLHEVPFDSAKGLQRLPVVVALMPPVPDELEFYIQILGAIGAPVAHYPVARTTRVGMLRDITVELLGTVGTRILVLDEFNSVLTGTPRQQRMFLSLLRYLSNTLKMALVCTGTPDVRQALLSDPQLRSRFVDTGLPVWSASEVFQQFLNHLVQSMPLRQPSPVDGPRLRKLLIERSGGITDQICLALRRAAIEAISSGKECIDYEGLSAERVWGGIMAPGRVR
ncbi:TniB family NTP-binding protein [Acetobacter sacchari]|uniref:TniB family NTP-binding protein n=1 Tax=Acetobacter sacchari TaxID=2661687 RepID=A0ABS3LWE4_9PROT|nr:TniB family NTP-binding protein [Acetobacter sacchari]